MNILYKKKLLQKFNTINVNKTVKIALKLIHIISIYKFILQQLTNLQDQTIHIILSMVNREKIPSLLTIFINIRFN